MAIEETAKLDIRAYYESNNLTYKMAHKYAEVKGYTVSQKTIEYWGNNEGWTKGKYDSLVDALESLMPEFEAAAQEVIAKDIDARSDLAMGKSAKEYFNNQVSNQMLFRAINKHFLAKEMIQNLQRSKNFANSSKTIGVNKTYHDMLIATYQTIHGKQTYIGALNPNILGDQELEGMNTSELMEIVEAADDEEEVIEVDKDDD